MRRLRRATAACVALLLVSAPVEPTSILAPTFEELVARADSVALARVVARQSAWAPSRMGRAIVTDVTFAIERTLKGPVYAQRTLEFLGGTIGDDTLTIDGLPEFRVGDRDVLFVRATGRPASPLVGFSYGRFRVVRESVAAGETVRTHDGRPLAALADIGNPRPPAIVRPPRLLSLDDFLRAIETEVRAQQLRR